MFKINEIFSVVRMEEHASEEIIDPTHYVECVELQLSEIDMLQSMFPDSSEFCIKASVINEIKSFTEGSNVLPTGVEYSIHLSSENGKVNLFVALPITYPYEFPDIYVRSDQLSRHTQHELNSQLSKFLEALSKGDLVVGSAIAWLQEHADEFLKQGQTKPEKMLDSSPEKEVSFLRLWVYSHHIYSKVKRKDIKDLAEELQLTGFCLPGKPGIICVEGSSKNIADWWHRVRSWNWQKIVCKKQEEKKIKAIAELGHLQRFTGFVELGSETNIRIKPGGFHVDMGDLFRFLEGHNSGYMFQELFGVTGR